MVVPEATGFTVTLIAADVVVARLLSVAIAVSA